jgi:hypothetical protein
LDVVLHLFDPKTNKPKPSADDPAFSEDICLIDENGLIGVACFAFEENMWLFNFDSLVDYEKEGVETEWKWYYPPICNMDIEWK